MSLFVPILLLGLMPAADQQLTPASTQTASVNTDPSVNPPKFVFPQPGSNTGLGDRRIFLHGSQTEEQNLCFTMRTYLFERHNGFAPEPVGRTTCQPATARKQKQIKSEPKLVPAAN